MDHGQPPRYSIYIWYSEHLRQNKKLDFTRQIVQSRGSETFRINLNESPVFSYLQNFSSKMYVQYQIT